MDRRRTGSPGHSRQWSGGPSSTGSSSPAMSPAHPHARLPQGPSTIKRTQNVAAKAAAQRLAQVMASQTADEEEDDDDLGFRFSAPPPPAAAPPSYPTRRNSNVAGTALPAIPVIRPNRSPSPALGRNFVDHAPSVWSTSAGRPSMSVRSTPMVPPSKNTLRMPVSIPPIEPPTRKNRENIRFTSDVRQLNVIDTGDQREASALRDELDMLQEENDIIQDKLQHVEERRQEAEARAKELEKQVAALGEGVSLEAKLLSRKEAALQQREAALNAKQTKATRDEGIAALSSKMENLKNETATAIEHLREAESEAKALRTMTQRMILTQEELEEVVLKRCWLARYWGLAVEHGICANIGLQKHEYWSSLAPLPFEVVIAAGQKAREESWEGGNNVDRSKPARDLNGVTGEGNIESMLSVEMGLRELSSLKVEDAVGLALAQHRRPNLVQSDSKSPGESKFMEAFELSAREAEDVLFKEAWLTYFWKRAIMHGVEEDIAEERFLYWVSRSKQSATSHDAVDVERGLVELRKLGIEQQLWEASRREIIMDHTSSGAASAASNHKPMTEIEVSP